MANNAEMHEPNQLPRHARLFGYAVDAEELLILLAADDHMRRSKGPDDPDGTTFSASVATLCAWTKLSKKTIQRRMHGYLLEDGSKKKLSKAEAEKRTETARQAWRSGKRNGDAGRYKPGMVDRRIFKMISEGSAEDNTPAMYQFNESALKDDHRVADIRRRRSQRVLPGFQEPAAPGHPIYPEKPTPNPSVRLTPGENTEQKTWRQGDAPYRQADASPSVRETHPSVRETHPSVRLTPDPSTICITNTVSIYDDDVVDLNFAELQKGLREIIPALDDRAIHQIVAESRKRSADCTAQEIVHFAWTKADALKKANNPVGLLIHAVPQCFEGSLLESYRQKQREFEEGQRRREAEKADQQRREHEELQQMQENMRREEQEMDRQLAELDALPKAEFEKLHAEAERAGDLSRYRRVMQPAEFEKQVRRMMAKLRMGGKSPPAN